MKKSMKLATFTALTALCGSLMAQTASFNISKLPFEVESLMNSDKSPNLSKIRSLCHNLTDTDISRIGKYAYPKRRKAVKRHIKHLCEDIELKAWQNKSLDTKEINHLPLVKQSRLSVMPIDSKSWNIIYKMSKI